MISSNWSAQKLVSHPFVNWHILHLFHFRFKHSTRDSPVHKWRPIYLPKWHGHFSVTRGQLPSSSATGEWSRHVWAYIYIHRYVPRENIPDGFWRPWCSTAIYKLSAVKGKTVPGCEMIFTLIIFLVQGKLSTSHQDEIWYGVEVQRTSFEWKN